MTYIENYQPEHAIERLLPDGTVNLIFELDGAPQYLYENGDLSIKKKYINCWISGMQSEFITISAYGKSLLVIQFKAGGAFPMLNLPLNELNNYVLDAELVFDSTITRLREQLIEQVSPKAKFLLAEQWLNARLKTDPIHEAVIDFAVTSTLSRPSTTTIQHVADQTGYSQRHFIELFKRHVGFSPKQYQKIVRFNKVLQDIETQKSIDWSQLSYDCGYYDQAHFIKDFKRFSGFNPKSYLKERGEYLNYVPVA